MPDEETLLAENHEYFSTLVYFEQAEQTLDELVIKEKIKKIPSLDEHIQSIHVLHGQKNLLIVSKTNQDVNRVEASILNLFSDTYPSLKRADIPLTSQSAPPVLLACELTDYQLRSLADDKQAAVRLVEAKTGLRSCLSSRNGKTYLTGLLFQFLILNEMFTENTRILAEINQNVTSNPSIVASQIQPMKVNTSESATTTTTTTSSRNKLPHLEWTTLYNESEVKGYFRIKPKQENESENNMPDAYYEIYMFVADLTDLNTDGLVNAANPNLHPGYIGDGIARRIREKAGKQMQDACKRIIRSERNNEDIHESEVVLTKASGKLKSKYVLHAVAPSWTKHIINSTVQYSGNLSPTSSMSSMASSLTSSPTSSTSSASACIGEKFEYLMEKTFANVLRQAHDPKLQLSSLAFPVSNTSIGGAFDLPVELCAHSLYTQLSDFKVSTSTCLKTICITSLEPETVRAMCDFFATYTENYAESSWAVPLSPMQRLVNEALRDRVVEKVDDEKEATTDSSSFEKEAELTVTNEELLTENQETVTSQDPIQQNNTLNNKTETNSSLNNLNMKLENLTVTIQVKSNGSESNGSGTPNSQSSSDNTSRLISLDGQTLANIKQIRKNKPRTISNSSVSSYSSDSGSGFDKSRLNFNKTNSRTVSESSGGNAPSTHVFKTLDMKNKCDSSCLFCQRENKNQLVTCANDNCITVYCQKCILNYFKNQKNHKCPSCRTTVEQTSSSPEPKKLMSLQNTAPSNLSLNNSAASGNTGFNYNRLKFTNTQSNSNHSSSAGSNNANQSQKSGHSSNVRDGQLNAKHAITKAKVFVKLLDESCDGYEKLKTIMVTFEIEDGIQSNNHPRPGLPYKGTTKKVYLPEVAEHREILAFYEKALHTGRLFKIAFSRTHDDYRVLLNQDVLLKTSLHGGGRFGYPDYNYIKDLLYMSRSCK